MTLKFQPLSMFSQEIVAHEIPPYSVCIVPELKEPVPALAEEG